MATPLVTVQRYTAVFAVPRLTDALNAVAADVDAVMVNVSPDTFAQEYVGPAPVPPVDDMVTVSVVMLAAAIHEPVVP